MTQPHLKHDDLHEHGNGQVSLRGSLVRLHRALDQQFLDIAGLHDAREHRFGTFIPAQELQKIGYLHSFPHLATFAATLADDDDNLKTFAAQNPLLGDDGAVPLTRIDPVTQILTPAACYHFYVQYQNQNIDRPLVLTTQANCHRREAYYAPLERQWNFSMREIVCIGSSAEVTDFLTECSERVRGLIAELGLNIEWLNATDPFFNPARSPKFLMQKLQPNKTEMVFAGRLAIGSVNFHRNYFGESFAIKRDGQDAYSGCVAFGVERWIAALLHQFGPDPQSWPALLRDRDTGGQR